MKLHARSLRRATGTSLAVMVFLGTFVAAAGANFPGRNGVIAFVASNDAFESFGISTIDPSTGAVRLIISNGFEPAWSADGTRLAFVRAGGIWVSNASGSKQTRLTTVSGDRSPAWSPNGKRITFDRNNSIWKMASNGKKQAALTTGSDSAWSPDGRRIAFYNGEVWTMNSDGSDRRLVASAMQFPGDAPDDFWVPEKPDWSPDGREIVLQYSWFGACESCWRLARVPAGGGEPVEIPGSYPGSGIGGPSWSPDGTQIAAQSEFGLLSFTLGGASRYLVSWPYGYATPSWQPLPVRTRNR
jgi:Tol biopolymer transport system component